MKSTMHVMRESGTYVVRSCRFAIRSAASCKRDGRNAKAVDLPSPRNLAEKLTNKQRALVV
jgi:hypothetical protein